jgi:iron complex transport system substrate-binding protein
VNINLEAVLALRPELVLGTVDGNPEAVVRRLEQLGVPIYLSDARNLNGIRADIRELGRLFEVEQRAGALLERMDAGIEAVRRAVAGRARPSVLFLFESEPISTAGGGTFSDELVRIAGGRSITADQSRQYLQLSIEAVLAAGPEVLILSSMDPARDHARLLDGWKRWTTLPAVAARRLYVVDADWVSRPSQRIVLGLEALARCLHPDAFADSEVGRD